MNKIHFIFIHSRKQSNPRSDVYMLKISPTTGSPNFIHDDKTSIEHQKYVQGE